MSVIYNELDPFAARWIENLAAAGNVAAGDVDTRSIRDLKGADLADRTQVHLFAGIACWSYALRLAGWPDDRPVWTGSCPCQPYSAAGKRQGKDDPRDLWPDMFRLIRECRPGVVFGEQVESAVGHGWLDRVSGDLEAEGYAVGATVLGAHSVGAPHIRQRLYWVADAFGVGHEVARIARRRRDGSAERGASGGLADADGREPGDRGLQRGGKLGLEPEDGGTRERLADAKGAATGAGDDLRARQLNPWSGCGLIPCADGKARRVEPSIFPLVDGSAFRMGSGQPLEGKSRVGMLKGYGNAIVPQVAARFIEAVMEAM